MRGRLLLLLAAATLLTGCGSKNATPPTTTGTTGQQVALKVYFYRGNALVPVTVHVPETQAIASAALTALVAGAPSGYRSAVPAGLRLESVAIASGVAAAHFSSSVLSHEARGQVVYTLTQFPTIRSLDGATRDDFADLTPDAAIFVAAPLRDSTVSRPLQ